MSERKLDKHNRWRSKPVTFRLSPEEAQLLDTYVRLSGLTKQDYIAQRVMHKDVVVIGNTRVYKALREELAAVLKELNRIEAGQDVDDVLLDTIGMIAMILSGLKGW